MTDSLLSQSVPQPHQTIQCQALLSDGCAHSGWLRKRSKFNRWKVTSRIVPWFQKYVVLAKGCLYQFNSEMAPHPKAAMSLYGFNSVVRASDIIHTDSPWAFKLQHIDGTEGKTYYFSAASQDEMMKWMSAIKEQMMWVNRKGPGRSYEYDEVNGQQSPEPAGRSMSTIETEVYPDVDRERVSQELRTLHITDLEGKEYLTAEKNSKTH